jgi:hypothetical protein
MIIFIFIDNEAGKQCTDYCFHLNVIILNLVLKINEINYTDRQIEFCVQANFLITESFFKSACRSNISIMVGGIIAIPFIFLYKLHM